MIFLEAIIGILLFTIGLVNYLTGTKPALSMLWLLLFALGGFLFFDAIFNLPL
jgi:hypothetical protein